MMGKEGYKNHEDKNDYNLAYWLDSAVFENVERGLDSPHRRTECLC